MEGAEPGDLLDIEILDIESESYGYTVQVPGFGIPPGTSFRSRSRSAGISPTVGGDFVGSTRSSDSRSTIYGHNLPFPRPRVAYHHHRP